MSYLLDPPAQRPPNRFVHAAIAQEFDLVVFEMTFLELLDSIRAKPYLRARITLDSAAQLESALRLAATVLPDSISDVPKLTRDPGDDYLLAQAVLHDIEHLVTGDRDLLVLGEFEGIRIVMPADFAALLDHLD